MTIDTATKSFAVISIGIERDDDDFAILATMNNADEHMEPEEFKRLVRAHCSTLSLATGQTVKAIERQDASDYVELYRDERILCEVAAHEAASQRPVDELERFKDALLEVISDEQLEEVLGILERMQGVPTVPEDDTVQVRREVVSQTPEQTEYALCIDDFDRVDYRGTFTLSNDTGACSPFRFERHDANCEPRDVSDVHKAVRDCMEAEKAAIVADCKRQTRLS